MVCWTTPPPWAQAVSGMRHPAVSHALCIPILHTALDASPNVPQARRVFAIARDNATIWEATLTTAPNRALTAAGTHTDVCTCNAVSPTLA